MSYTEKDGPFGCPKEKTWPLGTEARVRAAVSYYNNPRVTNKCTGLKERICARAKKLGIEVEMCKD